jgi:NAD(P)-dependent dehydrogenase (short-subunit alcohol dehydrogenase family)
MSKIELSDAATIVTGASRGIGPQIAAALGDRGARVALVAPSQPMRDVTQNREREARLAGGQWAAAVGGRS